VTNIIHPNKTVLGIVGIGILDKAVTEAESNSRFDIISKK
jgi:hypothetical protein